jgi:hypothetical protein
MWLIFPLFLRVGNQIARLRVTYNSGSVDPQASYGIGRCLNEVPFGSSKLLSFSSDW